MQPISLRQQKRNRRESEVISVTIELLVTHGFLELKMSDIAQATKCSMGAIYSHFSSKEDLLLACTTAIMAERRRQVFALLQQVGEPLDRLLMTLFLMWNEDRKNPHHYNLRQLSCNPSVWQRASEQRNALLNGLSDEMADIMKTNCRTILSKDLGLTDSDELTDQLLMSIAGLSQGVYQYMESSHGSSNIGNFQGDDTRFHLEGLHRLLLGWGLKRDDLMHYLRTLYSRTVSIIEK